ncbi:hypothetical protein IWX46DRAFT_113418 [Phyllosticta citricarpa]|uniref:Uncharacterized protein n=2 Tax=Phyllosticta TaxID=121621 RepID=A0ABR1MD52_9PEZI
MPQEFEPVKQAPLSEEENFFTQPTSDEDSLVQEYIEHQPIGQWDHIDQSRILKSPVQESQRPTTYSSFGENGTTASVTSHGRILQITKYFGGFGASGFFSVDLPGMQTGSSDPVEAPERTERLFERSTDSSLGLGLSGLMMQDLIPRLSFADDRWPIFEFDTQECSIVTQYTVKDDVVAQNYVFKSKLQTVENENCKKQTAESQTGSTDQLSLQVRIKDLAIRELDRIQANDRFNSESPNDSNDNRDAEIENFIHDQRGVSKKNQNDLFGYKIFLGPKKSSFVVAHQFGPYQSMVDKDMGSALHGGDSSPSKHVSSAENDEDDDQTVNPKAVGLVVSVFINGKAQEADYEGWTLHFDPHSQREMTITIGYRLQLMSNRANGWVSTMISARRLFESHLYPDLGYQQGKLVEDEQLDFIFRRNLEHILSQHNETHEDIASVAITCGDISGHQIESTASFFAFEFLLEIMKLLKKDEKHGQNTIHEACGSPENARNTTQELHNHIASDSRDTGPAKKCLCHVKRSVRIRNTCKAHLNWVFKKAWNKGTHCFVSYHWASGQPISNDINYYDFSPRQRPDPLPIIETFHFAKFFKATQLEHQGSTKQSSSDEKRAQQLPDKLYSESDDREPTCLEFLMTPGRDYIGEAFKRWKEVLDRTMTREETAFEGIKENGVATFHLEHHVWTWLALECLQQLGLQTGSNSEKGKAQSPKNSKPLSAEAARDVILQRFLVDEKSFLKQKIIASSRNVLGTRYPFRPRDTALIYGSRAGLFDGDKECLEAWANTLGIQRFYRVSEDSKFQKPLRYGLEMLLSYEGLPGSRNRDFNSTQECLKRASGSHGLFPGRIKENFPTETFFKDCDHGLFWRTVFELPYILWITRAGTGDRMQSWRLKTLPRVPHRDMDQISVPETLSNTEDALQVFKKNKDPKSVDAFFAKKYLPPSHSLDFSRVLEVSETWLYRTPEFLESEEYWIGLISGRKSSLKEMVVFWVRLVTYQHVRNNQLIDWFFTMGVTSLFESILTPDERKELVLRQTESEWQKEKRAFIKDVPRSGSAQDGLKWPKWDLMENGDFCRSLLEVRTAENAKKRVIGIDRPYHDIAVLCCCAFTDFKSLLAFFKRHFNYQMSFLDVTIRAKNYWETELHLSFWQLLSETDDGERKGLLRPDCLDGFALKGKKLARASISFRFDGDFLDRYWTCHIIENLPVPDHDGSYLHLEPKMVVRLPSYSHTRSWTQRRVFEQMILDRMLSTAEVSTIRILNFFESLKSPTSSDSFLSRDYFSYIKQWNVMIVALDRLIQDIHAILEHLDSWQKREDARGEERPRWTLKDETKYNYTISFWTRVNHQNGRDLRSQYNRARQLMSRIESIRASFRDDVNLRSAEDVRVFTSVTVIFLPLGFAAAIFSMNGIPERSLTTIMAKTAVTALFITLFILICVKLAGDAANDIFRGLRGTLKDRIMKKSILYDSYHDEKGQSKPTDQDAHSEGDSIYITWRLRRLLHGLWHTWHWVSYLMQEIPGSQLALACGSLHSFRNWETQHAAKSEDAPNATGTESSEPPEGANRGPDDQPRDPTKDPESPVRRKNTGSMGNTPTSITSSIPKELLEGADSPPDGKDEVPKEKPKESRLKKTTKATFRALMFATVFTLGLPIWLILGFRNGVMRTRTWQLCTFVFHSAAFTLLFPFFVPVFMINLVALNFIDVFRLFRKIGRKSNEEDQEEGNDSESKDKDKKSRQDESQKDKPADKGEEQNTAEAVLKMCLEYPAFARPFKEKKPFKDLKSVYQSFSEIFREPFAEIWEMVEGSLPSKLRRAERVGTDPGKMSKRSRSDDVV